jgi:hypothetical protein
LKLLTSLSKGAVVAVALLGMAPCAGGAPQAAEKLPQIEETKQSEAVRRAVAELAHPDAAVRERASRFLWIAGKSATAALTEAAESGDPEVAARARSILLDFKYGLYPDTPKVMRDIIVSYRDGQANDKATALDTLWRMGRPAYPVLVRIWLAEGDERLRGELYQQIARLGPEMASALIAEEEYDAAEKLLEAGVKGGAEPSIRALAAYRALRGEADESIRRLRATARANDDKQVLLLTYLCRAAGDVNAARDLLPKVPVTVREQLLVEMGDWKSLAALRGELNAAGASIEQVGLLAAYQRLSGQQAAADATLKVLTQGEGPSQRTSAVAMLVNGKAREAVESLRKSGNTLAAFQLLAAQQRYRDALELADNAQPQGQGEALRLLATKAAVLHHLGETKQAEEIFETLAEQGKRSGSPAADAAGLEAAIRWDLDEQATRFTANLLGRSRPNPDPAEILNQLFHRRGEEAGYWWSFFREEHARETPEQSLLRVRAIMQQRLPREEILALARQAREAATRLPRHWRYKRLRLVAQTLLTYKEDAEAEAVLGDLVQETNDGDALVLLGHGALRQRKWAAAAEYYSQAIQKDRSLTVPRYLRGYALVQAGEARAGDALTEQALLMPLADDGERYRLAEALREVGLTDTEARQYELILATGPGRSEVVGRVLWRLLFNNKLADGDVRRASRLADRTVVGLFDNLEDFDISAYLGIAHLAEKLRARALLADGKVDEAMKLAHACLEVLPASSTIVIDLAPALEKLGRRDKADELVAKAVTFHEKLIADHPKCASHHNSLAWTLARCRRDLDKALDHARRAAELAPDNCAILDTLAEVHFQRGEKEEAIRTIGKCVDLEPGVERHRRALERFEKSTTDTEPPEE